MTRINERLRETSRKPTWTLRVRPAWVEVAA